MLAALHAPHGEGYAYAVIGAAELDFYRRVSGAEPIEPGIYRAPLTS